VSFVAAVCCLVRLFAYIADIVQIELVLAAACSTAGQESAAAFCKSACAVCSNRK
jgi:hypothetical protein